MAKKELEIIARLNDLVSGKLTAIKRGFAVMARSATTALRGLNKMVFNLKTALAGLGITLGAKAFIRAAADIEKYRVQLSAIYGDAKQAESTLRMIRDFAAESPLETKDVIESFKMLEAVGIESTETVIKKLGNVALIFDKQLKDVSQGFISLNARTLREMGVVIDQMGSTVTISAGKGAKRMVVEFEKAGKNVEQINNEIRQSLLDIWDKQFPDAMKIAGNTFDAQMAVLKSRIFEVMADIGERYMPKIKEWITSLSNFLTSHHNQIVAFFMALPEIWDAVLERLKSKIESVKDNLKKKFNPFEWVKDIFTNLTPTYLSGLINQLEKELDGGWEMSYRIRSKEEVPLSQIIADIIERQVQLMEDKNERLRESVGLVQSEQKAVEGTVQKMSGLQKFVNGFTDSKNGISSIIERFKDLEEQGKLAAHNLAYGLKDSLSQTFRDIIRGTKSVADAFADMGNRIIDVFANIAAEIAAQQSIGFLFGNMENWIPKPQGTGLFGKLFGKANGGILPGHFNPIPAFANGTVATRPTLGWIGEGRYNEAVVPLPDGKSIPVEMHGNSGGITIHLTQVISAWDASDVLRNIKTISNAMVNEITSNRQLRSAIKNV